MTKNMDAAGFSAEFLRCINISGYLDYNIF